MNTDTEGLARMAGFFSAEEIDRDDCPVQHSQFADQCALAIAASMVVACGIGMTWCFAAWPVPTLAVSGLIGCGLIGIQIFHSWFAP